jgi:hypothetical protein
MTVDEINQGLALAFELVFESGSVEIETGSAHLVLEDGGLVLHFRQRDGVKATRSLDGFKGHRQTTTVRF